MSISSLFYCNFRPFNVDSLSPLISSKLSWGGVIDVCVFTKQFSNFVRLSVSLSSDVATHSINVLS